MKVVTGNFGKTEEEPKKVRAREALEFVLTIPELDQMDDAIIYVGGKEYSCVSSTLEPSQTYVMLDLLKMEVLEHPDEL